MPAAPQIDIRPVEPAFEQQIRALSDQTQAVHAARLPHIFSQEGTHQKQLLNIVFDPSVPDNVRAFMAISDDVLAGYVLVIPDAADDADTPINALIADICVVPEFQGKGIGRALLTHCRAEKNAQGWESLRAQVWQGNVASHQLFSAAGYTAERTDYRLGTPSPRKPKASVPSQNRWIIPVCIILIALLIGYMNR